MARIVKTTETNRKSFLLKAGLSIFLFLQIQMPDAAHIEIPKLDTFAAKTSEKAIDKGCNGMKEIHTSIALATPVTK